MRTVENHNLLEALEWRYATKKFDASKKIDIATWQTLEKALILTPSSYGLQPWKFLVVTDKSVMTKLTEVSWGQKQVEDCSHLVVIAAKEQMDVEYIEQNLQAIATIRGADVSSFDGYKKMMVGDLVNGPRGGANSFPWATRQCYIALGNLMTAAALLGIDTCPMEGLQPEKYDEILNLRGTGFKTVVACPLGFRAEDDKYSAAKKVRLTKEQLVKEI